MPFSGLWLELTDLTDSLSRSLSLERGASEDDRITSSTRVLPASSCARLRFAPAREASKDCCIKGVTR